MATVEERSDCFRRAISKDGFVSVKAVDCTRLVSEVCRRQECRTLAATALGRALASVLLIADGVDDDETFQVRFEGDGPLRGLLALSNGRLEARGYVGNPKIALEGCSVGAAVGKGQLKVVRLKNLPGEERASPFSSIVDIQSGEIAEDVNHYVATSEQREGALAAGVAVSEDDESVTAAGGWRIELLPGAPDHIAEKVVQNVDAVIAGGLSTSEMLLRGLTVDDVLRLLLADIEHDILLPSQGQLEATPKFVCTCSDDRVFRTLALLPREEVRDIVNTNDKIEARCEFCCTLYTLSPEAITKHLEDLDNKKKDEEAIDK